MHGKMTGKMCRLLVMAVAAGVVVLGGVVPSQAQMDVFSGSPIAEIVEGASPAVVNIDTETMVRQSLGPFGDDPLFREFFGEQFERFSRIIPMKGKGSGFIVSEDGYILTNSHVVADADKIEVTLADGTSYPAKIVGTDPTFDLAVIKIEAKGLHVLELGDSEDVRVGEWAIAIGNPYGFESTVTVGVISAKNRSVRARNLNFDGFLQTDAAINPGNSGGPLLNLDGEVVGINTAIIPYAQGIGFAVPVNMAKQVLDDLVKYGTVKRGWLGVYIQPLTPEFADAYGVERDGGAVVSDVVRDSPAAQAGLRRGDVIVAVDGEAIEDHTDLSLRIRSHLEGEKVRLTVIREGAEREVSVILGSVPGQSQEQKRSLKETEERLGLRVEPVTPELKSELGAPSTRGMAVAEVLAGSPADRIGLERGDIVLEVNGRPVDDVKSWQNVMGGVQNTAVLLVWRDGRTFFVSMRM
ncbi:MAG: DegQ family serine endoprotease [Thermovirgaceae bacterium]